MSRQSYRATEMPTVLEIIRKEKDPNLCYIEYAIIRNGSFELAPESVHFQVDQHSWTYQWLEGKKKKHLQQFHQALSTRPLRLATSKEGTEDSNQREEVQMKRKEVKEVENETACAGTGRESGKSSAPLSLSVPFCETGLSPVFLPAYNKVASLLHNNKNIVEAPGNHERFLIASDSEPIYSLFCRHERQWVLNLSV